MKTISALVPFLMISSGWADFPLNGIYAMVDNTCSPLTSIGQQVSIMSDSDGLTLDFLQGCSSAKACDPARVPHQTWGAFATGVQTNIGAEGLIVVTGLYARDNKEFVSFENESNDTAGGAPGFGTTIVVNQLDNAGVTQINYRGEYCTLKRLN